MLTEPIHSNGIDYKKTDVWGMMLLIGQFGAIIVQKKPDTLARCQTYKNATFLMIRDKW